MAGSACGCARRALFAGSVRSGLLCTTILGSAAALPPVSSASAADTSWTGATSSWFTGTNWDNGVPGSGTSQTNVANGGTAQIAGGAANAGTTLAIGNSSTVELQTGGSLTAGGVNLSGFGTLKFNRPDSYTFGSVVSGSGLLRQDGTGTTTLNVANTYSFDTIVTGGVLEAAHATAGTIDALGTSRFIVNAGGTLRTAVTGTIGGNNDLISGRLSAASGTTLTLSGILTTGGITVVPGLPAGLGITFNSATDTGTIVLAGQVQTSLTQANRGPAAIEGGTVKDGVTGGLAVIARNHSSFTVAAGATADFTATPVPNFFFSAWIGNLLGAGNVVLGSTAMRIQTGDFAGVISGPGQLIRDSDPLPNGFPGSGSALILSGANTYTGGTIINGGTLQLGNGGTSGSIVGNVANEGTLAFNRSDSYTFAGVISGSGGVQQNGTGTTTLTAASTYTGPTIINAGVLSVDGSLASNVLVNSGGTLAGSGTVGGITVGNGGTIAPGHSIGTLNVAGNVSFGPGSTYRVEANAAGQSDLIAATGTAALTGGTVQFVSTSINACGQASYTILTASGGVNGTFSGLTSNVPFLSPTLTYTSNSVLLGVTGKSAAFSSVAQTRNQRGVATALDASSCSNPLVQALLPLTASQAQQAFDQLSGEAHASTAGMLVDESGYMRSAVLGRLRQASYGGETDMAVLSLGGPQVAFAADEQDVALAYDKSPIPVKAPLIAPVASRDIVFWSQGFGAWGKFNGDGNAAALNRNLSGVITGFDARFAGNGRAGIAAGYTGSRSSLDGRGSANVETGHVAAYGGWGFGALNLRAGASYAFHAIDTDRSIVFPGFFDRATARYNGGTGQIFGEAGYGFAFGRLAVEPFAGAAWVHLQTDAFNETGGVAALGVAANRFEVGYSTLGVRAAGLLPLNDGMILVPRASAAWQHALNNVTPATTAAFLSTGTSFVAGGVPIARDALLAEAGLDLNIGRHATLGVSYTGQLASNVADHAAKGKFSWRF